MAEPLVLSLLDAEDPSPEPTRLREFLERLVASAAERRGLVVGEAEPGRYVLVMPALPPEGMKAQIDAALDLVLVRLGRRWPSPHVTDFGLRELYERGRDRWLDGLGLEVLVAEGKVGVVTVFCHEWLYGIATQVAAEAGLRVDTNFEEYARTGKVRVAGRTSFQLDVFANATEMAGSFLSVDHLIAKLLVLGELSRDDRLAARVSGKACPSCGALAAEAAKTCASCQAPLEP